MGSVVDSLKKLYTKMSGKKVKGTISLDDMIDKITKEYNPDGGSDSGSSSGSNVMKVTVDWNGSANVADKTFSEISTCITNGGFVYCYRNYRIYELTSFSNYSIDFTSIEVVDDSSEGIYGTYRYSINILPDDTVDIPDEPTFVEGYKY